MDENAFSCKDLSVPFVDAGSDDHRDVGGSSGHCNPGEIDGRAAPRRRVLAPLIGPMVSRFGHLADGPRRGADALVRAAARDGGIYMGGGNTGPAWAGHEHSVLILGPPRSGKTTAVVIPAILAAPGAVVSTSTKPDVLTTTAPARRRSGPCYLYDPSGTVDLPPGVEPVRWSPLAGCRRWDDALVVAHNLVHAARSPTVGRGLGAGDDHWTERAQALLAPVLHAAALDDADMATVLGWVDRHQAADALAILDREDTGGAGDLLAGIAATDPREQSGIWSTASGVLSAYRSDAALATTRLPDFDPAAFCTDDATLYVCTTGRRQGTLAPLVVGILSDVRAAAYDDAARRGPLRLPRADRLTRSLRPRRGGQHRPAPRSPRHGERGRGSGRPDPGVPAGPVSGTRTVGRWGRGIPVALRDHRCPTRDRRHPDTRSTLRSGRG